MVDNPGEVDHEPAPARYVIVVQLELEEAENLPIEEPLCRRFLKALRKACREVPQ